MPKSYKVPTWFSIGDIVEFMWNTAKLCEHFLLINKDKAVPTDHLRLNMESHLTDAEGNKELIPLDPKTNLIDIINYIWIPLHPEWVKLDD